MLNSIKTVQNIFREGTDFQSESVLFACSAIRKDGEYLIGISWKTNEFYWYDVSEADVNELQQTIDNGHSVGSFTAALQKRGVSFNREEIQISALEMLYTEPSDNDFQNRGKINLHLAFSQFFQALRA